MRQSATLMPTGNVTFLFSDIEGSTKRWEADPTAMQEAVRRHDRIMRSAIAAHGGKVFKTVGDAFCAAFAKPQEAVAAAYDAQRALTAMDFSAVEGLRVRIAINTGMADERDGDYFGPALNRVARMLAAAYGGQVLVSAATADVVNDALPPHASLRTLGEHQLKDLETPQTLYQLVARDLQLEFPPLRTRALLSNNLPPEVSSFVGRQEESAAIARMLQDHRCVTVVGPGGIGKTRTTLHVAAALTHEWPDGVWFVELAPISDIALVPGAVASASGVALTPDSDVMAALGSGIGRKRMLVILDNCEHVIEGAAEVAASLLRACPNVAFLASSRQPLGIAGERVFRMPELEDDDALALFIARAQSADAHFSVTDDMVPAMRNVCRRLDGIPLAIELAAARVRSFGVRGLQERLDRRFRVLVGGARDAAQRQKTLEAAIDWSYALLSDREAAVFRRLGAFAGKFTAEAAAFVAQLEDEDEALDVLESLDEKSLILSMPDGELTRFRLLESMRAYAALRLEQCAERSPAAQRHLEYFRGLFERAEAAFMRDGNDSAYALAVARDIDELRVAFTWSVHGGDVRAGAALATSIARPWTRVGESSKGIALFRRYLEVLPEGDARLRARLWTSLSWLTGAALHVPESYEAARHAVSFARASNDKATLAWALAYFALGAGRLRRLGEAKAALDEAHDVFGDETPLGQRLTELEIGAFLAQLGNDQDAAAEAFADHLALLRSIGDEYGATNTAASLAEAEHARGNTRRAIELVQSVLPRASAQLGVERHAGFLANLAGYLLAIDEVAQARSVAAEAVAMFEDRYPAAAVVTGALEHLALAQALECHVESAARLEGYCEASLAAIGLERETTERKTQQRLMEILRARLSDDQREKLFSHGAAMSPERAISEARQGATNGFGPR